MPEVQVGDLRIAYEQTGSGPPLVLLHGGFADRRDWTHQIEALADEFIVYAWDAPGCGGSSDPPESWRMPEYADCAAAWLQTIGVDKPHLAGISWGSTLALEVFHRHPNLAASLVLVGAYAGWAGSLPADEVQRRLDTILGELELPPEQWVDNYVPSMVTPAASPELREQIRAPMLETSASGAEPMLRAMAEADLRDVLPTINVPTLLLYGEKDVRSSLEVAYEMHEAITTSVLHVIPSAGHMCNAERPEEFNRQLREFVHNLLSDSADADHSAPIRLEP